MQHFTPEEANAALDEVRPLVEALVAVRRAHVEARAHEQALERKIRGNGGDMPPATLAEAAAAREHEERRLARLVEEIGATGAQVKDLDEGLIDFPARRRGETVLLCWKLGEDAIRYWHRVEDGFAGRRELPLE